MSIVDESQVYNQIAALYAGVDSLPIGSLYQQQVEYALGSDCTGKTVLDLGGGLGLHARKAIDRGAAFVDNVDVSENMLNVGKMIDEKTGRDQSKIRWYLGDIAKPLKTDGEHLPLLKEGYDIVMVNWTFDHAESMEELETMWANVAAFTKPGGQLISIRMHNPYAKTDGRYGVTYTDHVNIPGGCKYVYNAHLKPSFSAEATTMEASWNFVKAKAMAERHGFKDFQRVPETEMGVVKNELEFWKEHLDDPLFICITAWKSE